MILAGVIQPPISDHIHMYPHLRVPTTHRHTTTLIHTTYQDNAARTGMEQGVVQTALGQRHQLSEVVRCQLFRVLGDDAAVCEVVRDLRRGGGAI